MGSATAASGVCFLLSCSMWTKVLFKMLFKLQKNESKPSQPRHNCANIPLGNGL